MTHKYFCDLCGKEINNIRKVIVNCNGLIEEHYYDCCNECVDRINKYIKRILKVNNKER